MKDLAKISGLKVINSTSVRSYKAGLPRDLAAIARVLGVKYLVEGDVQRDAKRIRVNAQLIDATTGARRWAEHYDRDLENFFAINGEVAGAIAHQLHAQMTSLERAEIERRPTTDLQAYDFYLKASGISREAIFSNQIGENLLQCIGLLDKAVARDPQFFDAYCNLAAINDELYFIGFDHTAQRLAIAEKAINAVAKLRPDAAETHLTAISSLLGISRLERCAQS